MRLRKFCSALLLCCTTTLSHAETYTVGVENIDYYPLYAEKDGQYVGLAREILDKFAEKSGHTFQYKPFPIVRLTKTYAEGSLDLKFPDNPHWGQDDKKGKSVTYSDSVIEYTDGVMVLPGNLDKGVDAVKKLGTVRGFTAWDWLGLIKSGSVAVKEASNLNALIQQALSGRVDGAYFNVGVANYYLDKEMKQKGALVFDNSLPHTSDSYFLSSIKHPDLIKAFNLFLIDEAGWISATKKKYALE